MVLKTPWSAAWAWPGGRAKLAGQERTGAR